MGSAVVALSRHDFLTYPVPAPTPARRVAVRLLDAIEDKIELNRRMNATLEGMARAIFQDWFVAFGPTRAKMEGRRPYLAPDLWSLFPDRLDAEGKPEGWETRELRDLVNQDKQSLLPTSFQTEEFDHYSLPAFDAGMQPIGQLGAKILSNKTLVAQGALLISKLNPEIPRVWLTEVGRPLRGICSTEFISMTPGSDIGRAFLFGSLSHPGMRQRLEAMVTGTSKSHQRVQPMAMLALDIVTPPKDVIAAHENNVGSLLDRLIANRRENITLAETRDLLLPRLMSGELRVKDAERDVAAVA